ncbi:MarR family winged helix-turn-helix transcriptional regulator [Nocardioides sp.]|uniref:MarR family winged helix-turn-helix transcriptional regulator n=1 Tax=Nocardioides sp. TaxID=35761 RepID=UPI0037830964
MDDEARMRALGSEVMRLARRRATSYPGSVLEDSAFRILLLLVEEGPKSLRELAEELQIEQSTISRQVAAALGHGLVERYGGAPRLVRPTDAGREAYLHDGRLRGEVWSRAVAELGTERGEALIAALHDFNDALDRAHAAVRASR